MTPEDHFGSTLDHLAGAWWGLRFRTKALSLERRDTWSVRQKPASGGVTYSLSNQSFRDGTQMIVRVMNPSLWLLMTNR